VLDHWVQPNSIGKAKKKESLSRWREETESVRCKEKKGLLRLCLTEKTKREKHREK
jgi:hypothetical protein